jgi:hypothetical protein
MGVFLSGDADNRRGAQQPNRTPRQWRFSDVPHYRKVRIFLFAVGWVRLIPLGTPACYFTYYTSPEWWMMMISVEQSVEWVAGENDRKKPCTSATLSTTNPTCSAPGLEPGPQRWKGSDYWPKLWHAQIRVLLIFLFPELRASLLSVQPHILGSCWLCKYGLWQIFNLNSDNKKLRGLSPRANFAYRETAAYRRS